MSAHLQSQAESEASYLGVLKKQRLHDVPQIPPDVNLSGQTAIVTGSNSGLGLECARQLLGLGLSRLIMAVRSKERGEAAAAQVRLDYPGAQVDVWVVDMASYRSVQDFAARCETLDRLDIAILNAGLAKLNVERSEESGHEMTLQVNYLSTALLAILLLPKLKARDNAGGHPGRLTLVTSDTALWATLKDPGDGELLQAMDEDSGQYEWLEQYSCSKLLVAMFVSTLAAHVKASDVVVNVVNPSAVLGTDFGKESKSSDMGAWMFGGIVNFLLGRKLTDGVRTYLHSALVLGEESHGSWTDYKIRPYPPIMYSDIGKRLLEKLWTETLQELAFAGVENALRAME